MAPDVLVDEADAHGVLGPPGGRAIVRRRLRLAGVVVLLALVAALAVVTSSGVDGPDRPRVPVTSPVPTGPAPDPCRSPLTDRSVGVAPGSDWKTDPRAVDDLTEMAGLGVQWVRISFEWAVIEGQEGRYRWDSVDRVVRAAQERCLSVLAMVGTSPRWARRRGCGNLWCPPRAPQAFARFVTAVAERYGGDGGAIGAWEVWNEENHARWFLPRVDPQGFGHVLTAATGAIRAVEPGATVLLGGLAPSMPGNPERVMPDEFLEQVYATGAMDDLDGVAYHPYSYPNLPSRRTGLNGFIDQVEAVRQVMVDHGDGDQRVWLTEFGFPTPAGSQDQLDRQVETLVDGFATWRSLDWAGPLFWFSWRDRQPGTGDQQPNFGLRFADDRAKPALAAFGQELRR